MRIKNGAVKRFYLTIIPIFVLQALMLAYVFGSYYKSSANYIKDLGASNMKSQASMVENYLSKGRDVLWFAAETVDYMLENGDSNGAILGYLLEATDLMQAEFDENFTGIYGLINGEYIDGSGWNPPSDYDPRSRNWYIEAIEAEGRMVLSSPYVDAETGGIIISYSQMLSDGESVISLDIVLNEVQMITEEMTMGDMGYGFVVDSDGLVVAHSDASDIGLNYLDDSRWTDLMNGVYGESNNEFEISLSDESCTVFTDKVADQWYVVIVANNDLMYKQLRSKLLAGIIASILIYAMIVGFCLFSINRITKAEESEQKSLELLQQMNMNVIKSLASTIDAKDRYTSGHSQRVAEYALEIARRMGKSEDEQRIIYYAGLLHDVGKVRVPEHIINKPGKLTDEEFDYIKIHTVSGYHILSGIHEDENIGYGAKYHHERYDGKGYPNGLEGEEIPEIARIIAVADAYDAMASDRSYRKALPQSIVRSEIVNGRGTQFDPAVADVMLTIIDEDKDYDLRQRDSEVKNVLVIDDEKMIHEIVSHFLKNMEDVEVFGAFSAEEAMKMLLEKEYSLVLLDLKMPDIDGFKLFENIREKYDVPVIIMTGEKSLETIRKISELGIDDYLTKPLSEAITKEAVHGILQKSDSKYEM